MDVVGTSFLGLDLEKEFAKWPSYFKNPKSPTKDEMQRFIREKPEEAQKLKAALELRGGVLLVGLLFLAYAILK